MELDCSRKPVTNILLARCAARAFPRCARPGRPLLLPERMFPYKFPRTRKKTHYCSFLATTEIGSMVNLGGGECIHGTMDSRNLVVPRMGSSKHLWPLLHSKFLTLGDALKGL